ncbi:DUF6520 family protein [Gelidibacter salicanalis]|uniref:Uncharacterized protein n=1 Tax=Gelidibacter salicanalis TaxID=291193 RepID=A0A934NBY9_9FLAO|nr:DUF6520 family protein [Gelidibacter salicanalis]MBJ7880155.1 hypothetical protein [Gelidibacter salicanalis]
MKTRILKSGMPVMAFLMAIAFAFASESTVFEDGNSLRTGYIFQDNVCVPAPKDCNQVSLIPCVYNGNQVYAEQENSTSCIVPLTHNGL